MVIWATADVALAALGRGATRREAAIARGSLATRASARGPPAAVTAGASERRSHAEINAGTRPSQRAPVRPVEAETADTRLVAAFPSVQPACMHQRSSQERLAMSAG